MLVEFASPAFDVDLRIAYATADHFTGAPVYRRAACFLLADAADRLTRSIGIAARHGLRLRIFDAIRPSEAQWAIWRHTPDPKFLSDPRCGSPRSRGAAVDVTLLDVAGGAPDMATGFDDFGPASGHGSTGVSVEAQRNRLPLDLMTDAGWDFYRNEWWHYQLFDVRRLPMLSESAAATAMM